MNIGAVLMRPVGPLPAGAWIAVIGGGLYIMHRRSAAGEPDAAAGDPGIPGETAVDASSVDGPVSSPDGAAFPMSPIFYLPPGFGSSETAGGGDASSAGDPLPAAPVPPPATAPALVPVGAIIRAGHAGAWWSNLPAWKGGGVHPTPPAQAPKSSHKPAPSVARPKGRTVIVRPGDTLSAIGARTGVGWQSIYAANRDAIETTAKRHGRKSSDGGHWIYAGTALRIPA